MEETRKEQDTASRQKNMPDYYGYPVSKRMCIFYRC
mgnify:CR=1 FL=1